MGLVSSFEALAPGHTDRFPWEFDVIEVGSGHALGRNPDGSPVLLVNTLGDASSLSFRLAHLEARGGLELSLRYPNGTTTATRAACVTAHGPAMVQTAFLELVHAAPLFKTAALDATSLQGWLTTLAQLFAALQRPGRRSILGLWGELLAISLAPEPTLMAAYWHGVADATLDFADGAGNGIEVKTTSRSDQIHEFALDQLRGSNPRTLVLSIRTQADINGTTLRELIDSPELVGAVKERLLHGAMTALGSSWEKAMPEAFSRSLALETCRVYAVEDVPSVDPRGVPPSVQNVHFAVDLSRVVPLHEGANAVSRACVDLGWR